jgi:hypothetical protein
MITNRLGLPEPLVKAIENDPYDNQGTLSVTTLLKPAQAIALTKGREGEMTEDAADRIWSLMGQIGHSIIERAAPLLDSNRYITERRFFMDINGKDVPGYEPLRISGAADLIDLHEKTVYDFKFTSGWAVKSARQKGGKYEWQHQLSMLAMLAREGRWLDPGVMGSNTPAFPIEITHGKIVAIVRDWNKHQAAKDPEFPQQPVEVIDMDILPDEETREWLDMRIEALKFALDGGAVPCTDEERWAKPGGWAVYKNKGAKKALRVLPTEDDISAWIGMNRGKLDPDYRLEERPTVYGRCSQYCNAAKWCQQHQETLSAPSDDTE